jgi:predicted transcriptional regulator
VLEVVSQSLGIDLGAIKQRRKCQWERGIVAYVMTQRAGMTQREVADVLGVGTGAAVSLMLSRLRQELENNNLLREQLQSIEAHL